jgi:hypothetical protein
MTDRSKFEQMLEHLVNEDQEAAKDVFHQIVVEKSRQIYENILAEDFEEEDEEEVDEAKDEDDEEEVDEAKDEDDEEEVDENFAFDEADDEGDDIGGDKTDDMLGDIEASSDEDDMDDMGGEDDIEDRVVDLEDAIDDLRAEFEKMMGGEDDMDDMGGDDMGDMGDDMGDMDDMGEEDPLKSYESDNFMREYIEKVGGATYDKFGKMGDSGTNTKSPVAGKNDMGGTTANILGGRNGQDAGEAGTAGGQLKGNGVLKGKPQDMSTGNINVPGGNAGKTAFKKKEPGHGAEKKGAAEQADNKTSPLSGLKSRAK